MRKRARLARVVAGAVQGVPWPWACPFRRGWQAGVSPRLMMRCSLDPCRSSGVARVREDVLVRPVRVRRRGGWLFGALQLLPAKIARAEVGLAKIGRGAVWGQGAVAALVLVLGALALRQPVAAQEIVVTFGGDVNFARSRETPDPYVVQKFGNVPIAVTTRNLAPFWDGDVNFINVETVVSDRDGLQDPGKSYVFRSHPESLRHLMRLGVNAFALANNHAQDHGFQGLDDTRTFFAAEGRGDRPLLFAGIGAGKAAFAPRIFTLRGVRIALSAATFGSGFFAPQGDRVGIAYVTMPDHYQAVLDGLRRADADLRILSLHYGTENETALDPGQALLFRRGLEEAKVNLVLGHHPHVVRGVEAVPEQGQAIFYSLGNLLFVGGANRDGATLGLDYGLLGRAYFHRIGQGWQLSALEVLPLKGVHRAPHPLEPDRVAPTLNHLNRLSLRSVGARAVNFSVAGPEGVTGIACFAQPWGPRAKALCCPRISGRNLQCELPDDLM